jgi:hypothetical protein
MLKKNGMIAFASFALLMIILPIYSGCIRDKAQFHQYDRLDENLQLHLIAKDTSVIFLGISKKDYDLLPGNEKDQVNEIVSDFESNINRITEILRKNGVNPIWTAKKELIFQYVNGREERIYFDTKKYPVAFALFREGKKPRIHYGIVLSDEILRVASEYFEMEIK